MVRASAREGWALARDRDGVVLAVGVGDAQGGARLRSAATEGRDYGVGAGGVARDRFGGGR
jgi:hypothetical protein